MKIGVYDDGTVPLRGGGFTFKSEVLRSVEQLMPDGTDEVVLVRWPGRDSHQRSITYREKRGLTRRAILKGIRRRLFSRAIGPDLRAIFRGRWGELFDRWLDAGDYRSDRISGLVQQLIDEGVDLMVYLEPWDILNSRIPYICICWDMAYLEVPFFPETNFSGMWPWRDKTWRAALRQAVHVVTGTETCRQQIMRHYGIPPERVSVLPFPTPSYLLSEEADANPEMAQRISELPPYVFYPASFWPHKNHVCLLKALAVLRQRGIALHLVLCGANKGNREFVMTQIESMKLTEQVHVFDFLPRADVNALYRSAEALVFPTFIGPDNLPPLEAFVLGCPVVASSVAGAAEQLGDAALFFDPAVPEALADRLQELLGNETLRRDLVNKGKARVDGWDSIEYARALLALADRYRPYQLCFDLKNYRLRFS